MSYDTLHHPYDWEESALEDERIAAALDAADAEENASLWRLEPDMTEEKEMREEEKESLPLWCPICGDRLQQNVSPDGSLLQAACNRRPYHFSKTIANPDFCPSEEDVTEEEREEWGIVE